MASPSKEFTMPPGTVRLIDDDGNTQSAHLVLQPVPSDDPNDPLNWTTTRKLVHFMPILALTVVIFTQSSIPPIFWNLWIPEFNCTYTELNASMAINYAGTATGCIFFIPLAIKYGRRPVYIISLTIIVATGAWQAAMKTVTELYISSLIFGLASATNSTIVEMTIADLYFVHQRGAANGAFTAMTTIGSFLSPQIAGYVASDGNWRQSMWITFGIESALLVYFCLFVEESKYIPRIDAILQPASEGAPSLTPGKALDSSLARAGSVTPPPQIPPSLTWRQKLRLIKKTDENLLKVAWLPCVVLFQFPVVMYTGLQYAFTLVWVSVQASIISMVFSDPPYNFGTIGIGNMNLSIFVGCVLGTLYAGILSDRSVIWLARRNNGYYEPEMRLPLLHLPALALGSGLIMFGVTCAKGMHWIYPAVGSAIFGFGVGGNLDIVLCVLIDSCHVITGEAFVAVAFLRNALSVGVYFAIVPWVEAQGVRDMFIIMGVMATALAFLHIPLQIWGKKIRERTEGRYRVLAAERSDARRH